MSPLVSLYGLAISAPVPLPGPPLDEARMAPDVVVRFGVRPPGSEAWGEDDASTFHESESRVDDTPVLRADRPGAGEFIRLRYAEGIRFHVATDGRSIWADWVAPLTDADAIGFLLGPVLGLVLRQRGVLALHGSAVVMHGRAWGFLGPGGSGKSTLAAAFARSGVPLLTEDVLALRPSGGEWLVSPAYDHVRIWEDSADLLLGAGAELPALSPTWAKRELNLTEQGWPHGLTPSPLGGVFVLEDPLPAGNHPRVEELSAPAALVELVANSYVNYLADPSALGRELVVQAALSLAVRAWRLYPAAGAAGVRDTVTLLRGVIAGL